MHAVNQDAVLKFIQSLLPKEITVPVGLHDLSGAKVRIELPDGATVERGEGVSNGFTEYTPTSKGLSLAAIYLFISRSGCIGPNTLELWKECVKEAVLMGDTKIEELVPVEALQAQRAVEKALQDVKALRKTPAKTTGVKAARIFVNDVEVAK